LVVQVVEAVRYQTGRPLVQTEPLPPRTSAATAIFPVGTTEAATHSTAPVIPVTVTEAAIRVTVTVNGIATTAETTLVVTANATVAVTGIAASSPIVTPPAAGIAETAGGTDNRGPGTRAVGAMAMQAESGNGRLSAAVTVGAVEAGDIVIAAIAVVGTEATDLAR
jgi:hypothetical protein